jgi:glycine/D-amino acid oxidase-like deaminating enzyme
MGHLVSVDGSPEELALCAWSIRLWHEFAPELSAASAYRNCGTLWLAEYDSEQPAADTKQAALARENIDSHWLDARELKRREPMLRDDLAGALRVPFDGIVYAPAAARWFLTGRNPAPTLRRERVTQLDEGRVQLTEGHWLAAEHIVLANGLGANELLPEVGLLAKKGQLAITDRYPRAMYHQIAELAYAQQAHNTTGDSVSLVVQARPTGQILIGSSRQLNDSEHTLNQPLLARMLERACHFLPPLGARTVIRSWAGFRAATEDGLPLIGAWPDRAGLWLALGHEGHGVTTATGTAQLIAAGICNETPAIDPTPYRADRIGNREDRP